MEYELGTHGTQSLYEIGEYGTMKITQFWNMGRGKYAIENMEKGAKKWQVENESKG